VALILRNATIEDGAFLLAVRNDGDVRSQSKHTEIISDETHRKWLEQYLHSSDSAVWIIEQQGEKLGYVRAQRLEQPGQAGTWLLSIALHSSFRGQHYGTWGVREACRLLRDNFGAQVVIAEVLNGNAASLKLFQSTGFVPRGITPTGGGDFLRFELSFTS
jgi:RimJ/RimL family protein N-acetyltransferase